MVKISRCEHMSQSAEQIKTSLPNLLNEHEITDRTDYSHITNEQFIEAVFGDPNPARPFVVGFKGNPATQKDWSGRAVHVGGSFKTPTEANNYISCSSFNLKDGAYRRKKDQFHAYHWILCDDIGTKASIDRVTLAPSWIIETSKDNYQYGYILAEPLTDDVMANRLVDGVIAAGLCDEGANGATSRLGRLPVAINGKTDFQCKLIEWQPERRFSVQEIVDGLQIELKEKNKPARKTSQQANDQATQDDVHIPRATDNPVILALVKNDLYKSPLGGGKHDITCPWVNEHTDSVDNGTAYFEPSESYPIGGFKCMHGHCAARRVSALYTQLGISKAEAKHLPIIRAAAGELNSIVDAAEKELSKTGHHYQRGGLIVTVITDPQTRATNVKIVSPNSLTRVIASIAIWQRYDKRDREWVTCDPTERVIKILHDASQYPHMPILNGIVRQPYFRSNGSLVCQAGYDAETGMFGVFDSRNFFIPDAPTKVQAETALFKLNELLSEFSFKTEYDKAAALSGILTAAIRSILRLAPLMHVSAHQIGSGKSFLCELLTLFATPEKSTPHSFPSDDDEMKKMLLAELLTAPAVIEFDNLTTDLIPHKSLCTVLTSENISGRILGQSKTATVGTRALFLSSGNNVDPVRDMTRRTVTINLDPECETPATREFKKNPVNDVAEKRGEFISAALTIIRAWIVAGKPITAVKPLNSYGEWSLLCRQPLLWLGLKDPAQCVFDTMLHDPDREYLSSFLAAWLEKYSIYSTTIKKLIEDSANNPELGEIIKDVAGERDGTINNKKLGWWVKRHSGRIVDGLRIVLDDRLKTNTAMWRIEKINHESVSSVLSVLNTPLSKFGSEEFIDDSEVF